MLQATPNRAPNTLSDQQESTETSPHEGAKPENAADDASVIIKYSVDAVRGCCTPSEALKVRPGVVVGDGHHGPAPEECHGIHAFLHTCLLLLLHHCAHHSLPHVSWRAKEIQCLFSLSPDGTSMRKAPLRLASSVFAALSLPLVWHAPLQALWARQVHDHGLLLLLLLLLFLLPLLLARSRLPSIDRAKSGSTSGLWPTFPAHCETASTCTTCVCA